MSLRRLVLIGFILGSAATAFGQSGTHHGDGVENTEFVTSSSSLRRGPSLRGVDPVALIDQGQVVRGSKDFRVRARGGLLFLFANQENRQAFKDNKDKYLPVFKGRCPVTYHTLGRKRSGDPNFFAVYEKQLYLFINKDAYDVFVQDPKPILASLAAK